MKYTHSCAAVLLALSLMTGCTQNAPAVSETTAAEIDAEQTTESTTISTETSEEKTPEDTTASTETSEEKTPEDTTASTETSEEKTPEDTTVPAETTEKTASGTRAEADAQTKSSETEQTTPAVTTVMPGDTSGTPYFDLSQFFDPDADDYPDKLYQNDYNNVTLTVMRCGEHYITYDSEKSFIGWQILENDTDMLENIPDGGFAVINADITRMSGGIAGFASAPYIRRLHSCEFITFDEAAQRTETEEYVSGKTVYVTPLVYSTDESTYCIVYLMNEYYVYRDGEPIGRFGTHLEAENAMGMRALADDSAEITDEYYKSVYVFRCGDTYLAYISTIFFNPYWTPLLNEDFGNELPFLALEDGEVAYLSRAHVLKVNGGEAGYVNAPMIVSAEDAEKITYDWLTLSTSTEHYAETPPDEQDNLREYSVSEYLIFFLDGRYHVYREHDGIQEKVGVYDSVSGVDEALGRNGGTP
ncbi:MAG: hypothetical protein IK990_10025 [Ruminiclostridium sp.]|nr:hypothetical protein [Ruminiclostridium sp.]